MTQESQFELFNPTATSYTPTEKIRYFKPNITLTFDNIAVLAIALLMLMVLSFSLGVEKGKRLARLSQPMSPSVKPTTVTTPSAKGVEPVHTQTPPVLTKPVNENHPVSVPVTTVSTTVTTEKVVPIVQTALSTREDFYTVQVASFKQEKYARQEAMSLKQKGYEIFVIPKGQHSIVCVGRFAKKNEAMVMSGKLRKYYKDCVVRNL